MFRLKKSEELKKWETVLQDLGYTPQGSKSAAEKIVSMNETLKNEYIKWLETGFLPDINVEGFDLEGLMDVFDMSATSAFITLDWLLRDPDEAKSHLAEPLTKIAVPEEVEEEIRQADKTDKGECVSESEK